MSTATQTSDLSPQIAVRHSQLHAEPMEEVVLLGDAAVLTQGNTNTSVENKRSPYGG
ncbi:albusnodin family lasso peptide [Streptomyces cucumeris]|uniref:albusnodin family lasso peptide n=1 Tax=Streptomyces cucumeris TaxID=2962890 RepID=UPI003EB93A3C